VLAHYEVMAHESLLEQPLVVHTRPAIEMDDEEFFQFCQLNRELQIERSANGDIIIMAPEGGSSGSGSSKLNALFQQWAEREGTGRVFGSSTGFILPSGALRSPDVAWVRAERLEALTNAEWERFLPLCPDFVLELRSPSDSMRRLHEKMNEYRENGARLGWLLDPVAKQAHVYRPREAVEPWENPATLSGEPVLKGFVLDVPQIWAAMQFKKS
jgi:Uma2 family endonuclease